MGETKRYYSHGKLLLTAEYTVLDNAIAIGLPSNYGQSLEVSKNGSEVLVWESYLKDQSLWFTTKLSFDFNIIETTDEAMSNRLIQIFKTLHQLQPSLFDNISGLFFKTHLEFDAQWGLGTSSTLINNLASWAAVDPYQLLGQTFGGSGYDIACAKADGPILFQRNVEENKEIRVAFDPPFKSELFFVYLNQKKNSREAIQHYKSLSNQVKRATILEINEISKELLQTKDLSAFENLLDKHEELTSNLIQTPTIKKQLFPDYKGTIKSLGAWGGDFILVTGIEKQVKMYFENKGYKTVVPYREMILS